MYKMMKKRVCRIISLFLSIVLAWLILRSVIEAEGIAIGRTGMGKKWAVLVAGSNGYDNCRHQADICHAYQILKGGLMDENIMVFMYDDIAFNSYNPRPGVIINNPNGHDVYEGVPKDYTGSEVNPNNLYAVILGNRSGLTGGSGKVVDSGPDDFVFIYYAGHGSAGLLCMPDGEFVYANDFVHILKKKHATKAYKRMVIYLEACESRSMFEGLLPNDINIYANTASTADENSFTTYCPHFHPAAPPEYITCLGDSYSISWMEDSDKHDMANETLRQQYGVVRRRTLYGHIETSSHVMQYGNKELSKDFVATYMGTDPANGNIKNTLSLLVATENLVDDSYSSSSTPTRPVSQRDLQKAPAGSIEKVRERKELADEISEWDSLDGTFRYIGDLLFGMKNSTAVLTNVRPAGQPLVDDWDCFKTLMKTYQIYCGSLSRYGIRYSRAIANMCNAGIYVEQMVAALSRACPYPN